MDVHEVHAIFETYLTGFISTQVGYCLHANGFQFPLHIPGDYTTGTTGPGAWSVWKSNFGRPRHHAAFRSRVCGPTPSTRRCPRGRTNGKLQILGFVAFLEFFDELGGRVGAPAHYMRGGLPGAYPSFKKYLNGVFPHPVPLDLYDPFGIFSNASPEKKARGRLIEINNGRLAMIGLFLCGNQNFTARSPPRWRGDVGSSPLTGNQRECTRLTG